MSSAVIHNFRQYLPGLLLLCIAVVIGLCTYQDYGIAWDEPIQREMGQVSYDYVFKGDKKLPGYIEKDHGVGFEVPLIVIENALHIQSDRDIYLMRHLVTHLLFLLCCFCGYVLAQHLFRNKWLSCLAFLLLVFHPRIYAHSFFNSKDAPLMGMFIVSFLLAEIAFRRNKYGWYILLGAACGYAASIRILGVVLLGPILLFFLMDLIQNIKLKHAISRTVISCLIFLFSFCLVLYVTFPTLWPAPINNFLGVFDSLSHFRWGGKVLFNGSDLLAIELPACYLPIWFGITTPILWLLSGFIGLIWIIVYAFKNWRSSLQNTTERNFILYAFCFAVPPVIIISMHSVVYDDWRHIYFIYPAFVLMTVYVLNKLKNAGYKYVITALIILQLADTAYFMVRYHPHHQVYFNQLVSHKSERLRMNYELDYWGSSYKEGLEYILAHDTAAKVRIFESLPPVANALAFLPEERKARVVFVDRNDFPYYFITGFRNHKEDYTAPEVTDVYYEVKVLNSTILRVYRCK